MLRALIVAAFAALTPVMILPSRSRPVAPAKKGGTSNQPSAAELLAQENASKSLQLQEKYLGELLKDAEFQRQLGTEAFNFFKQQYADEQVRMGQLDERQRTIDARSDAAFDYAQNRQTTLDQREDQAYTEAQARQKGIDTLAGSIQERQRANYEAGMKSAGEIDTLADYQTGQLRTGYEQGRARADAYSAEVAAQRQDLEARAAQGDAQAAADLKTLDEKYRPMEEKVVDEAMASGDAAAQERMAGRVGADIESQIAQQRAAGVREAQRRGMGGQVEDMLNATQDNVTAVGGAKASAMNDARLAEEDRGFNRRASLLSRGDALANRAWQAADMADSSRGRILTNDRDANAFQNESVDRVNQLANPKLRSAAFRQTMQDAANDELDTALTAAGAGLQVGDRAGRGLDRATTIAGLADDGLANSLATIGARNNARGIMQSGYNNAQQGSQSAAGITSGAAGSYGNRANYYADQEAMLYGRRQAEDAARRKRRSGYGSMLGGVAGAIGGAFLGNPALGASIGSQVGGAAGNYFSDPSLKEVGPEFPGDDALDIIEATPVREYEWKEGVGGPEGTQVGAMADDLAANAGPAVSDGHMVNNASMHGLNQAAIKALSKKVKRIEGVLKNVDSLDKRSKLPPVEDDDTLAMFDGTKIPDQRKMYPPVMFS